MKAKLPFFFLLISSTILAQEPIFSPSMTITSFTVTSSPNNEEVDKIIDGSEFTKFLDFDFADGMGFTVDLGGTPKVASSISITTANDAVGRDPMNYEVLGSNDGTNFVSITNGSIPCVNTRFLERNFTFTNTTAYAFYRIIYSSQCATENSLQVAETQLFGESLSIDEFELKKENVEIIPNPNSGIFTVKLSKNSVLEKINITDLTGKIVKEIFINNTAIIEKEIDLKQMKSGVYLITLFSSRSRVIKKFIII